MHESINTVERTQQTEQCRASEWSIVAWEGHNLLMNQRNKPRESTHTHTRTYTTSSLVPDQIIPATSEMLLLFAASSSWAAQTRPRRRVRNTTFILWLLWSFFCWGWGCASGWRGCELVPLFIGSLCWLDVMNKWLFLLSPGLHRSHLQYPPW